MTVSTYTAAERARIDRWLRLAVWSAFALGCLVGLVAGIVVRAVLLEGVTGAL